jgi:hypothetical protein
MIPRPPQDVACPRCGARAGTECFSATIRGTYGAKTHAPRWRASLGMSEREWRDSEMKEALARFVADRLSRDSDGTATAAACEDIAVPKDCQARQSPKDNHRASRGEV